MDSRICQTFSVSPAEPGDYPLYLIRLFVHAEALNLVPFIHDTSKTLRRLILSAKADQLKPVFNPETGVLTL